MKDFIKIIFFVFIVPYLVIFGIKVAIEMLYELWWLFAFWGFVFVVTYGVGLYNSYKQHEEQQKNNRVNF